MVQRRGRVTQKGPLTLQSSGLPNFVHIVDRFKRAVVGIEVVQEQTATAGRLFPFNFDRSAAAPRNVNIGTGFVFHKNGLILTNEHVIHGATRVYLRYFGRERPVQATVVGSDYRHDIAILKSEVPFTGRVLKIGSSKGVRAGQWVVAIGSPLGLDHTVTVGIISSTDRPLQIGDREYPSLFQTDAAINRGNSGGPLISLDGQVVGMNTAVSQSSQGIGFAIAADVLQDAVKRLS
jgi:S1-C subfamily serine protease